MMSRASPPSPGAAAALADGAALGALAALDVDAVGSGAIDALAGGVADGVREQLASRRIARVRHPTPSLQWSSRSRAVTVVLPAPFGPATTSRTGFTAPCARPADRAPAAPRCARRRSAHGAFRATSHALLQPPQTHVGTGPAAARRWARTRDQRG